MATLLALPSPEEAAAAVRERVRSAQARAAETGLDYDGGRPGGKTLPRRTSLQLITTEEEGDISSAVDTLSLVVPRKTRKDLIAQFQVPPAPLWLVEQVPALDQLNLGRDPQEQQARAAGPLPRRGLRSASPCISCRAFGLRQAPPSEWFYVIADIHHFCIVYSSSFFSWECARMPPAAGTPTEVLTPI